MEIFVNELLTLVLILGMYLAANRLAQDTKIQDQLVPPDVPLKPKEIARAIVVVGVGFIVLFSMMLFIIRHIDSKVLYSLLSFSMLSSLLNNVRHTYAPRVPWWVGVFLAVGLVLLWRVYPSWITLNIAASLAGVSVLVALRELKLSTLIVIAIGIAFADVCLVFLSSRMLELASLTENIPLMLTTPKHLLSLAAHNRVSELGLGDVILPGAVVMFAFRIGREHKIPLGNWAMAGYVVGYSVATVVVYLTRIAQPATIYLFPGAMGGLLLGAYRYALLKVRTQNT